MPLCYIAPLEPLSPVVCKNLRNLSAFMVSSCGVPLLRTLAASAAMVTGVDFSKEQFLWLNILMSAMRHFSLEEFGSFVEGDLICKNQQAIRQVFEEVVRRLPFVQWSTLTTLLQEYLERVNQHGKPVVREWYSWLDQKAYSRLREAVASGRVITRLGEFIAVLQFEPDEHYGYIDLSNIREWKFFHSRGFYFPGSENFAADGVGFEIWDRKLSELCFNKLGKLGWLRNSMYPEFWEGKAPSMDDCEYWQEGFSLSHQEEFEVLLGHRMEKLILTYYRKR